MGVHTELSVTPFLMSAFSESSMTNYDLIRKTWRRSIEMMTFVFDLTENSFKDEILREKIRKQALNISISISHGHKQRHTREIVYFFRAAQVSTQNLQHLFYSSHISGYISEKDLQNANRMYEEIFQDADCIINEVLKKI